MKKIDFLIVAVILIIAFLMFLLFNNKNSSNVIQIIVNSEVVDEIDIYNNIEYKIESDESYIYIYKNNILVKQINNTFQKNIYNIIQIKDTIVTMKESNCSGKDCMHMKITFKNKLPIICTNGVVIKISNNDNKSDILISSNIIK